MTCDNKEILNIYNNNERLIYLFITINIVHIVIKKFQLLKNFIATTSHVAFSIAV